jgi:hypothetical protein
MKNIKYYLVAIVVLVLLFVGAVFGSKNALPDNLLYSVKTGVLEKITYLTKSGDVQKTDYALGLAEKRLEDLIYLKNKNQLTTTLGSKVRDNFNQQTIVAQEGIMKIGTKEGNNSKNALEFTERLMVDIEGAKAIFNIDQLPVVDEGVPVPKATTTKIKR